MDEQLKKTGTTTIGLVTKNGVVLASEKRATMDHIIAHKNTQKVYKISDSLGMTTAGLVGDAQVLVRYMRAEVELFNLTRNTPMSVNAASNLLSNILNQSKYFPYWVQLVLGGYDLDGYHVYSIDAAGGSIEDKYTATGSGSLFAYGVLEDNYSEGMPLKNGVELAKRAVEVAMKRDSASGNGVTVATLNEKEGFKFVIQ